MSGNDKPMMEAKEPLMDEKKAIDMEKGSYEQAVFTKEVDQVEIKAPPEFIGLTREQLEAYRNDPFWKRLRLFLFILFWVAWIAMFVAAIVIVAVSPKCPPKIVPHWWQSKLCYQVWTSSFKDSGDDGVGDLNGLKGELDNLKKVGVQTIWPVQLLESKDFTGYQVSDFEKVDERLGTNDDLKGLIKAAHSKIPKMFVIMDFPVTTSVDHPWFKNSSAGTSGFEDMYTWTDTDPNDSTFYTEDNGRWYFHLSGDKNSAVLNWNSDTVRKNMTSVLRHWLDQGINGFYIGHVQYMSGKKPKEIDWDATYDHLANLTRAAEVWKNDTDNQKQQLLLFTSVKDVEGTETEIEDVYINLVSSGGLNYVVNDDLLVLDKTHISTMAQTIKDKVDKKIKFHRENNETWPMWELGNPYTSRVGSRMESRKYGELMTLVLLMMPGSINNYYGDEITMVDSNSTDATYKDVLMRSPMQWDDSANGGFSEAKTLSGLPVNGDYKSVNFMQYGSAKTPLKMFRRIAKLRQTDDTFLNGNLVLGNLTDEQNNVLTMARYPTKASGGTRIYMGAINFSNETTTVDFTKVFTGIGAEGEVLTMTSGSKYSSRDGVDLTKVDVEGIQGVIVKIG